MKEITRVHIAKQAYDIEIGAKKDFEEYMKKLELYAGDAEILADIEIRITELLAEAGVEKSGVITAAEVASVRQRLGEPEEFAGEDAPIADNAGSGDETNAQAERRLYRDVDGAALAGAVSGIAKYFGANVFWMRVLASILIIASGGSALIVYVVLWLAVPPARTAAEKLQLAGEPVTLASIRKFGEQAQPAVSKSARILGEILRIGGGIVLVLMGAFAIMTTAMATLTWSFGSTAIPPEAGWSLDNWGLNVAWLLCIIAGLLFATLCFVLASAVFRRTWSKRLTMATTVIVVAGMVAISMGVGLGFISYRAETSRVMEAREVTKKNLPENFQNVKTIEVEVDDELAQNVDIVYTASSENRWELEALPGVYPSFEIEDDGVTAKIELALTGRPTWSFNQLHMSRPQLKIYGPAVENLKVASGNVHYYNKTGQERLTIEAEANQFSLAGTYQHVVATSRDGVEMSLGDAAIENLTVNLAEGLVQAGVVKTLTITQPEACEAYDNYAENRLRVQAVSSGNMTLNSVEMPAQTTRRDCGTVFIGNSGDPGEGDY